MSFKSSSQPFCRWCGKPIKKLVRSVWLHKRSPNSTRNETPTEYAQTIVVDELPTTRQGCQRYTNGRVVSITRWHVDQGRIGRFGEWDGESYVDEFFDTGSCAMAMGYSAVRTHNLVTDRWRKAVASDKAKRGAS
jgi:hypothetical protein